LDPDPGLQAIREAFGQVNHARGLHGRPDTDPRSLIRSEEGLPVLDSLSELLGHPNSESLGHDPVGKSLLLNGIVQRRHSASMTR
jgi:hypothetical protein